MTPSLICRDILAYSLQIGLVACVGGGVPAALRLRMPRARLLYWQFLLVACLALPWLRGWRQEIVASTIQAGGLVTAVSAATTVAAAHRPIPFAEIALWLLAAGIAVRLFGLAIGIARLAGYRRRGRSLPSPNCAAGATLLLSDDIAGPVTFGWRDPVILLPADFPGLPPEMREAILCHELLHVTRRDWLFTIAEELARAVLWFHPAIWWIIGEIQLAREQTVDRAVIETTRAHGPYVDALLMMARATVFGAPGASEVSGIPAHLDLAPAPMFLRRRHLKKRLMEVVGEVGMPTISRTRMACLAGVAVVFVAAACWVATGAFPLSAAPQMGNSVWNDAAGVAVNLNGSQLMHRSPVIYPADALAKGVEGTVVVQVKLDANGEVSDAAVLSGPDELRKAVLQSVLNWHFDKSEALTTQTVNIDFVNPGATAPPASVSAPPPLPPAPKLDRIVVTGLTDSARSELLLQLPVQEGGEWTPQTSEAVRNAVKEFDSHLRTSLTHRAQGALELNISLPSQPNSFTASTPSPGDVYRVGNGVTPPSVLLRSDPQYTEEARTANLSGAVYLAVVIGTDGKAENIQVTKSLGMGLDEKAIESVEQWTFRPGTMQGVPVNVRAVIEVNFRLRDKS